METKIKELVAGASPVEDEGFPRGSIYRREGRKLDAPDKLGTGTVESAFFPEILFSRMKRDLGQGEGDRVQKAQRAETEI